MSYRNQLKEGNINFHITINGMEVDFGSEECILDIVERISDACRLRDSYPHRSDSRIHYTGILRTLRRELKKARKLNPDFQL